MQFFRDNDPYGMTKREQLIEMICVAIAFIALAGFFLKVIFI
jgi:hypothetical protein